jgi:hypothetical protein
MDENIDYADFYSLTAYPGTPIWNNPNRFDVRITDRSYNFNQLSSKSNVELPNMSMPKLEYIVKDIRTKWKEFKKTKTPWIKNE